MNMRTRLAPSRRNVVVDWTDDSGAPVALQSLNPLVTAMAFVAGARGTFTLTVDGQATAAIPVGADASTVRAAIEALSGVGAGNVAVAGRGAPYLIAGAGSKAGHAFAVSVGASGLLSSFAAVPDASSAPGSGAAQTILNTDAGCVFAGTWDRRTSNPTGSSGAWYVSAPPGPLTPCSATYTFAVAPGTYDVGLCWFGDPSHASNAPYMVFDGPTLRDVARVDQRTTPAIVADAAIHPPFARQYVSRVYCATGTLTVVLTNDADAAVVADAVLVRPVAGLLSQLAIDDSPDDATPLGAFASVGTWTQTFGGPDYQGYHRSNSHGPGAHATWTARMLSPGTYDVQVYWLPTLGYSSAASYAVHDSDGSTQIGSALIDQRNYPAGGVTAGGVTFQSIGTVTVTGRTASVVLSGPAGQTVVADAVLFRPTGSTPLIGIAAPATVTVATSARPSGGPPSIAINAGSPVSLGSYLPPITVAGRHFAIYPLAAAVAGGATVTFTAPENWASTALGPAPAATNQAVPACTVDPATNQATLLPHFDATTPRTMSAGWNTGPVGDYNPIFWYADLMKQATAWGGVTALDARGFPTATTPGGGGTTLTQSSPNFIDGRGLPNAPYGAYTVRWDGAGDCSLNTAEDVTGRANLSGSVDRTRVFAFGSRPDQAAPNVGLRVDGPCTNIRIYPPGVATDGSQLFHPATVAMYRGATSVRFSGPIQVNPSNVVDYADFPPVNRRSFGYDDLRPAYQVVGLTSSLTADQLATARASWGTGFYSPFLVTTSTPHNFKTGHVAVFVNGTASFHLASGSDRPIQGTLFNVVRYDASSFICIIGGETITSATLAGGVFAYHTQDSGPPEHVVAFANVLQPGGLRTVHLNVPHAISDAAAATLFAMIARDLHPSLSVRVELGNEPWNSGAPFFIGFEWFFMEAQRRGNGLSQQNMQVQRSSEIWKIAEAAFAAAGRSTSQIIRMINTIYSGGLIQGIVNYADHPTDPRAGGVAIPLHEISTAPYFSTTDWSLGPYDSFTPDQVMDVAEMAIPGHVYQFAGIRAVLDGLGHTEIVPVAYEWGPNRFAVGGTTNDVLIAQSQAGAYHPRNYGLTLRMLQESQDGGARAIAKAGLTSGLAADVGPPGAAMYGAVHAWNMPPGIGDGSDGGVDNRPVLAAVVPGSVALDFASLCSPELAAFQAWGLLERGAPPPPAPPTVAVLSASTGPDYLEVRAEVVAGTNPATPLLEYGPTASYGSTATPQGHGATVLTTEGTVDLTFIVTGLAHGQEVYYRVSATDAGAGLHAATDGAVATTASGAVPPGANLTGGGRRRVR